MIKNYALLDDDLNVIGTISFPDTAPFSEPHHVPNAVIEDGEIVKIGMVYDLQNNTFTMPKSPRQIGNIRTPENDPPLPDGKRHLFNMFRRSR